MLSSFGELSASSASSRTGLVQERQTALYCPFLEQYAQVACLAQWQGSTLLCGSLPQYEHCDGCCLLNGLCQLCGVFWW